MHIARLSDLTLVYIALQVVVLHSGLVSDPPSVRLRQLVRRQLLHLVYPHHVTALPKLTTRENTTMPTARASNPVTQTDTSSRYTCPSRPWLDAEDDLRGRTTVGKSR